jgi:hypothetical protein
VPRLHESYTDCCPFKVETYCPFKVETYCQWEVEIYYQWKVEIYYQWKVEIYHPSKVEIYYQWKVEIYYQWKVEIYYPSKVKQQLRRLQRRHLQCTPFDNLKRLLYLTQREPKQPILDLVHKNTDTKRIFRSRFIYNLHCPLYLDLNVVLTLSQPGVGEFALESIAPITHTFIFGHSR